MLCCVETDTGVSSRAAAPFCIQAFCGRGGGFLSLSPCQQVVGSVLDSGHPRRPAAVALVFEKKREEKQLPYARCRVQTSPARALLRSLAWFPFRFVLFLQSFKSPLGGASGKELAGQCQRRERFCSDPWVGKIPWGRKCQPTPDNPMDRGAWWAALHGVAKSRTRQKRLSTHAQSSLYVLRTNPAFALSVLQMFSPSPCAVFSFS